MTCPVVQATVHVHRLGLCLGSVVLAMLVAAPVGAQQEFRTDANPDPELPWFVVQPGEFPPEGSAHYFSGELIAVDHVNRKGTLRLDRTDAQNRSHWDLPVDFELLPYGAVRYRGAPAALVDVPLGTHLHGLFYIRDPDSPPPPSVFHNRKALEADFTRAFLLEDDFSHAISNSYRWRIESFDAEGQALEMRKVDLDGQPLDDRPRKFHLLATTGVFHENRIADHDALAEGQHVVMNLTWATLYGPGRLTEVWIDDQAQRIATRHQLAKHRQYQRERGLAGWVDEVNNQTREVTVTLFGGIDPALLDDFKKDTNIAACVAEPTLRTYDPVNDRKFGPVLRIEQVEAAPGSSGVRITFRPDLLLEGYRPQRIVRLYAAGWPLVSLPKEEELFPERD